MVIGETFRGKETINYQTSDTLILGTFKGRETWYEKEQEWGNLLDTGQHRLVPDFRAPVPHTQPVGSLGVTLPLSS